jgi:hypothetical protein
VSAVVMVTKEAARNLSPEGFNPYRGGGKKRSMADLFAAGRQQLAERRAREAEANGKPEGV